MNAIFCCFAFVSVVLVRVIMPPMMTSTSAVSMCNSLVVMFEKVSMSSRYSSSGWLERKKPRTAFSFASTSLCDHSGVLGSDSVAASVSLTVVSANDSKKFICPESRSFATACPACIAPSRPSSMAARFSRPWRESMAPHLMSASMVDLLTVDSGTRSVKS